MGRKGTKRTTGHESEVKRQRKAGERGGEKERGNMDGKGRVLL